MPARLSSPKVPMWSTTYLMSALGDLAFQEGHLAGRRARLGPGAPQDPITNLDEVRGVPSSACTAATHVGWEGRQEQIQIVRSTPAGARFPP